jgi:aerobic-type carbon monoxide dehydrogenase small subunit (CoxS/CutS family)
MTEKHRTISVKINDEQVERPVLVRQHLVDFLRDELDLSLIHI